MAELTTWRLVAETKEHVGPITLTVDGFDVGPAFQVQVVPDGARPDIDAWVGADVVDLVPGVLVGTGTGWPLVAGGRYTVFARYTSDPEVPVLRAAIIKAI